MENTVTISLETYQEMENKIAKLEKENQEKTIYKYIMHPVYGYVVGAFLFYLLFFFPQ